VHCAMTCASEAPSLLRHFAAQYKSLIIIIIIIIVYTVPIAVWTAGIGQYTVHIAVWTAGRLV